MSVFDKIKQNQESAPLEVRYKNSVANLLLVVAFTAINVVSCVVGLNSYFLFSAFVPYYAVDLGMYMCGKYPAEYYYGDEEFFDTSFLVIMVAIAAVMLLLYLLCWHMAKKKKVGWLVAALVLFGIDTLAFFALGGFTEDGIFDVIFHVWVIFSLINGIRYYGKLKKAPAVEPQNGYSPYGDMNGQQPYNPYGDTDGQQPYAPEGQYYTPEAPAQQYYTPDVEAPSQHRKEPWE